MGTKSKTAEVDRVGQLLGLDNCSRVDRVNERNLGAPGSFDRNDLGLNRRAGIGGDINAHENLVTPTSLEVTWADSEWHRRNLLRRADIASHDRESAALASGLRS